MNLEVRLFATLKEQAGTGQVSLEVDESSTVTDLLTALIKTYPTIQPFLQTILISVNQEYAKRDQSIHPGDEIALFPPVSGG